MKWMGWFFQTAHLSCSDSITYCWMGTGVKDRVYFHLFLTDVWMEEASPNVCQ